MSFLLPCPNCGPRDVAEFVCAGEVTERPASAPSRRQLTSYLYFRKNVAGVQREWWFHRFGCALWFQAERDTRTNEVVRTELAATRPSDGITGPEPVAVPDAPAT